MNQVDRLIWIDGYLHSCQKSPQTRPAVVDAFNATCDDSSDRISYNTMVRDMEMLVECGAELLNGRGGWYSTALAFRCNQTKLNSKIRGKK
jgi:hypothetical protein